MSMRQWLLFLGITLCAAISGGALAGWWLFQHVDARVQLKHQPMVVSLPEAFAVTAEVLNALDVRIDGDIAARVPIDQRITVPIQDTLRVIASVDSDVPIRMTVPVREHVLIDQVVAVDTQVKVRVLGRDLTLPVRGDVPIKAMIPVNLDIPVDQRVRVQFSTPADVRIDQPLSVPLKTVIDAVVPIRSQLRVPVQSALQANIRVKGPVPAVIEQADLRLPLRSLALDVARKQP